MWTSLSNDILALHFGPDGTLASGWPATGKPILGISSTQSDARALPTPEGGMLVSWVDLRGGTGPGLVRFIVKLDSEGNPVAGWPVDGLKVNSLPTAAANAFMISDGTGGAFIGWDDNRDGQGPPSPLDFDIYGQHVLGTGVLDSNWPASGLPVCVAPSAQYFFEMAEDGSGGAIFVWDDYRNGPQIYAVRIRTDGSVAPGWTPNGSPMAPSANAQTLPEAVGDGSGGVFGFWSENYIGDRVVAQHWGAGGTPADGWTSQGKIIADAGGVGSYRLPIAVSDGKGGAIVAYTRSTSTYVNVYAQRVYGDIPVSTRASFLDAQVAPGNVHLRWTVSDALATSATVYRRQEATEWEPMGLPSEEGRGTLTFNDRGLEAGRYAYRLGIREGTAESFTTEAWVDVPGTFSLRLSGFQPNPAVGTPNLAFTLLDDQPALLEVYDVRGRLMISRQVGGMGAGLHRISLDQAPWRAGVYWLRLTRGDRILTAKGLVTH